MLGYPKKEGPRKVGEDTRFFNVFENTMEQQGNIIKKKRKTVTKHPKSGIIRKEKKIRTDLEVVGYGSRLFKNDVLAFAQSSKLLIPLLGKEEIYVDRHDARLILTNLEEGLLKRFKKKEVSNISHKERKLMNKINRERYWDMKIHNEEDELKAEIEKRSLLGNEGLHCVPPIYDVPNESLDEEIPCNTTKTNETVIGGKIEETTTNNEEKEGNTFIMPYPVPPDMEVPTTDQAHLIIESTCKFVLNQGEKAEKLLKIKQANNPNFRFLLEGERLHAYYKFVLACLKDKPSPPPSPPDGSLHISKGVQSSPVDPPPSEVITPPLSPSNDTSQVESNENKSYKTIYTCKDIDEKQRRQTKRLERVKQFIQERKSTGLCE